MMHASHSSDRGDTIIEVLVAIAVFSMVAVGALMLMNKGTAMAQRSLEITQVRQQIDAQADLIRLAHSAYVSDPSKTTGPGTIWKSIKTNAYTSGAIPAVNNPTTCPTSMPRSFVVARTAPGAEQLTMQTFSTVPAAQVYSRVDVNRTIPARANASEGLWAQAIRIAADQSSLGVDAYDVYIRACWSSLGQANPMTLGTIVRLYEP